MLNADRIHYLDSMRAILMIFGILLHSANIFSPTHSWLVSSTDTSIVFSGISNFINTFRMPAFFMVSGFFFTYISLKKSGIDIADRIIRLGVPLVFVAVTLNVLQQFILQTYQENRTDWLSFFADGRWISHLWFLINLIVYNLAIWVSFKSKSIVNLFQSTSEFLSGKITYLISIILFPFLISGIYGLNRLFSIYGDIYNITSPFLLLFYFQFFLVGLCFGFSQKLLDRFSRPGKAEILVFCAAYLTSLWFERITTKNSFLFDVASSYNQSIATLLLSSICFYLFRRFLDSENAALKLISASSYSIYLLHHIIVVLLGIIFISISLNIYASYLAIVSITFLATMLLHQVICRSWTLSFLINGIRPKKFKN